MATAIQKVYKELQDLQLIQLVYFQGELVC